MVQTYAIALLSAASSVAAFPRLMEMDNALNKRLSQLTKREEPPARAPNFVIDRPNTGVPPLGFDAEDQYVDVTDDGPHPWMAPGSGDRRGECPGLNAAANHGFLPRDGIPSVADTITGLGEAYNMAPDLALVLAVAAVAFAGDPVAQTWSIGGSYSPILPLTQANGILGAHNTLENDASFARGDAYLNGGNVGVFENRRFEQFYNLAETYGFAETAAHNDYNTSEEVPGGTLDRDTLKSFFAVSGETGSFTHEQGQERIPLNWYRRPTAVQYNTAEVVADLQINNAAYPGILRIGGNTGTTDSFVGVDLKDLTGGVFNADTLFDGNNGACFLYQATLAAMPSATIPALGAVGSLLGWALDQLGPAMDTLGCPQLADFNNSLFDQFPGAN